MMNILFRGEDGKNSFSSLINLDNQKDYLSISEDCYVI